VSLEDLGNLGDFLGGVAVIATLVYLARQIRENTRSTRLAAMQSTMLAAQDLLKLPVQDPDVGRVFRVGLMTPDELTEDEFHRFRYFLLALLRVHEDMFVQHKSGVIDDETWHARAANLGTLLAMPGGRRVWETHNAYRPDFQAWLDSRLDRKDPPAA